MLPFVLPSSTESSGVKTRRHGSYEPPVAPECLGGLLDSREMLLFGLPSSTEVLLRFRKTGQTYLIPDEPKPGSLDQSPFV
ncbi:hypothetical protein PtA15_14A184 [Puccinia triticina]|uniref:Uncharacterized protein n=1 Tax=Puccinia triticina TaxID=208348 RepID=A0ABY7D8S8_9BASI|nr:uncharacterized protein PtA15_14A184 [Puccinia triticina]WAQ91302.1 hypothetical protein PtA15_14A184 [Puccinia triticina]WAR62104.1 hypothetical protein PtB15_14B198 [Puccinia triticina]